MVITVIMAIMADEDSKQERKAVVHGKPCRQLSFFALRPILFLNFLKTD